jgi:YegS/Rv2252/BmrU family lipid kinase
VPNFLPGPARRPRLRRPAARAGAGRSLAGRISRNYGTGTCRNIHDRYVSSDVQYAAQEHGDRGAEPARLLRAAVVVNPTKVGDSAAFRHAVRAAMQEHGWSDPLWLETTADDPGRGPAREAVAAAADVVLACGGDGTVTACAEGVAGTGVPLAVVPIGTGNLLARNIGLPADLRAALSVALTGADRAIDLGVANGAPFVVMAGLGLDARMLSDTPEPLKRRLGWAAYAISVLRHLRDRPMRVTLTADGGPPVRLRSSAVIIGNVGWLRGGVPLLPDARPDDGKLDAVALRAQGVAGWLAITAQVLLRRAGSGRVTRFVFSELVIQTASLQPWELDGEVMGTTSRLVIAAQPGHLLLRHPAKRP